MRPLTTAGDETAHINLDLADLSPGEELELPADGETAAVVMSGTVDAATAGGVALGRAGGRASVFEAPGDTVYAPAGTALRLRALDGAAQVAIASASAEPSADAPPARVIGPAEQRIAEVGQGNWSRTVRTILGPEHDAQRLLLGETINPRATGPPIPRTAMTATIRPRRSTSRRSTCSAPTRPAASASSCATSSTATAPRRRSWSATTTSQ
jgi:5-deoxy-D-glucuronate isomerase